MSKFGKVYHPAAANGVIQGDDTSIPYVGTERGMVGKGAPYGADISRNAKNRLGGAHTEGDAADDDVPSGDSNLRFTHHGAHSSPDNVGKKITYSDDRESDRFTD